MKPVRINDRFCQVCFEEENPPAPMFENPFHKWGATSEEESEAHLDASVGENFSKSECSEHDDRNKEIRGEEKTVQFPVEEDEYPKGDVCISGGINSVVKSQNDA